LYIPMLNLEARDTGRMKKNRILLLSNMPLPIFV
jgi:hypothetical protein